MSLETRLTDTLNNVLRTSGYIFEIINNNKRQSNLITGPNNQLIPPPITNQLASSIALFDQILDETVSKFNDARWCVEQVVENKQKQEELRIQEELERQKRAEAERIRKEEEEAALKRKQEEEKKEAEIRARKAEEERLQREAKEKEEKERKAAEERKQKEQAQMDSAMDPGFGFDMDLEKGLDIPNPSDILSSISYKGGNVNEAGGDQNSKKPNLDDLDLDVNAVLGEQSLLGDLDMDMLGQEFDGGLGGDEAFDVDNFLNSLGNGD